MNSTQPAIPIIQGLSIYKGDKLAYESVTYKDSQIRLEIKNPNITIEEFKAEMEKIYGAKIKRRKEV